MFRIINEISRAPVVAPVEEVLRDGVIVGLANHTVLISREGGETAIEDSAAPIRDADGRTAGAVMVFRDVTERRRAEEALRKSEQAFRATFHQAAVGIAVATLDGRLEEVNRRFASILGYTPEELRERTFLEVTHPDDQARTREHAESLVAREYS